MNFVNYLSIDGHEILMWLFVSQLGYGSVTFCLAGCMFSVKSVVVLNSPVVSSISSKTTFYIKGKLTADMPGKRLGDDSVLAICPYEKKLKVESSQIISTS